MTPKVKDVWQLSPPPLDEGKVHVWIVGSIDSLPCLGFLFGLLTSNERSLAERRVVASDRIRSKACRGLLRALLSRYLSVDPASLVFHYSPHGKPFLTGSSPQVSFNLSHSGDSVVLAIARNHPVGIDIEAIREVRDAHLIVDRFFSDRDRESFRYVTPASRTSTFLRWWTRKEAVAKAVGAGLSLPRDSFDVSIESSNPFIEIQAAAANGLQLKLVDLPLPPEFTGVVAVATDAEVITGKLSCNAQGDLAFALY